MRLHTKYLECADVAESQRLKAERRATKQLIRQRVKVLEQRDIRRLASDVESCKTDSAKMHRALKLLTESNKQKGVCVHDEQGHDIIDIDDKLRRIKEHYAKQFNEVSADSLLRAWAKTTNTERCQFCPMAD